MRRAKSGREPIARPGNSPTAPAGPRSAFRPLGFPLSAFRPPLFAFILSLFALPAGAGVAEIPFQIVSADHVHFDEATNRVLATGNVVIEYQGYRVSADVLEADLTERVAIFRGRVTINTGERTVQGNYLSLNLGTRVFELEGGRVLIPPEELEMGAREPVYAIGARIVGYPDRLFIEKGGVTTCNLEPPHYLFDAQRVTLIPGRRLEARKVSFYALGHKLITLPGISIPLRTINQQSSRLVPVVGQSVDEGYYLKAAYFYVIAALVGNLRLDLMSKKGIGVGFDQPYNFKDSNGSVNTYYLRDQQLGRQDLNARASHNQRVGEFNFRLNGNLRQNSLDYISSKSTSLLTDFAFDRRSPDGTSTNFGVNRSANSYAGSETGNWTANLRHTQTVGDFRTNLNMDLSQPFGLSTASTGRLSSRLNLGYTGRGYTSELVVDRIDTLGGGTTNYFAGTERLPEIRVTSQAVITFGHRRRPPASPGEAPAPDTETPTPGEGVPIPGEGTPPPPPAGAIPAPGRAAPAPEDVRPAGPAPAAGLVETPAPAGTTPAEGGEEPAPPPAEPGSPSTAPAPLGTPAPAARVLEPPLRRLPLTLEMRVGNLSEAGFVSGTNTSGGLKRIRSQLRVAGQPELLPQRLEAPGDERPVRKWEVSLPFEFNQMVYKADEAQWAANANPSVIYRLGSASQITFNESILVQNGFTPFQSDFFPDQNTASLALTLGSRITGGYGGAYPGTGSVGLGSVGPLTGYGGYPGTSSGLGRLDARQAGQSNISFRTGYDFENNLAQDLVIDTRYQIGAHQLVSVATGYDWLGKNRFGKRNRLRDIQLRLFTDYADALQLSGSALYDTTNDRVSSIRASVNTKLIPHWSVQAVVGKFPTGFSQQYMVTRDLHCWEASMTYVQESGRRLSGTTLWLTIKAFPNNRLFGISQSGGYLTSDLGQIY